MIINFPCFTNTSYLWSRELRSSMGGAGFALCMLCFVATIPLSTLSTGHAPSSEPWGVSVPQEPAFRKLTGSLCYAAGCWPITCIFHWPPLGFRLIAEVAVRECSLGRTNFSVPPQFSLWYRFPSWPQKDARQEC